MQNRLAPALVVLSLSLAVARSGFAQTLPSCIVQVLVTDATGAKIPNATVSKTTPASAVSTNGNGEAKVRLCDGATLSAQAQGFKATTLTLGNPPQPRVLISLAVASSFSPIVVEQPAGRLEPELSQRTAKIAYPEIFELPASHHGGFGGGQAPAVPPSGTTLALIGLTSQSVLTGEMIAGMPHQSITVENGHTHASETYSGVPLVLLLEKVGAPTGKDVHGKALSEYVVATGSDAYKAVLALAEAEPDFHPGQVLVADQMDGKPLDVKQGPFKLIVSEDKHPARSVHSLVKLELKQAE